MDTSLTYSTKSPLELLSRFSPKLNLRTIFSEALIKYALLFLLFFGSISLTALFHTYYDISLYLAIPLTILSSLIFAGTYRFLVHIYYQLKPGFFSSIYRMGLLLSLGILGFSLIALVCIPLDIHLFEGEMGTKIDKLNLIAPESQISVPYPPLIALIEEYNEISLGSPIDKYLRIQTYFSLDHPQLYKSLAFMKGILCLIACLPLFVLIVEPRRSEEKGKTKQLTKALSKENQSTQVIESSTELPAMEHFDIEILHKHRKGELDPLFSTLLEKYMLEDASLKQTMKGLNLFFQSEEVDRTSLKDRLDKDLFFQIFKNTETDNDAD